tara:strand:- start:172 stop:384 length:213 start_codon:yes stop_codon:yes gene_type:complete
MKLEIGDLVRVRGVSWVGRTLGIVTEIKNLVHDPSGVKYCAITAWVGEDYFTFSEEDFDLVKKRKKPLDS